MSIIKLDHLSITYDHQLALQDVSGSFERGCLTAIVGPNGAGKSTLVKAIMGEFKRYKGTITKSGISLRDFGYLPQASEIDRQFPLSVADLVLLGAWHETGAFGGISKKTAQKAEEALATVGLKGFERRNISALSAGQFQRVLFARLLLQDAPIIILDEPFNAIDERTMHDLLALICALHKEGRTIIAVLHDIEQVKSHFPTAVLLARRLIAWGPTEITLSHDNLLKAKALAEHWDENSISGNNLLAKEGAL